MLSAPSCREGADCSLITLWALDAARDIREGISICNRKADLDPSPFQTHKYVDENAHESSRTLQIVAAAL